MNVLLVSAGGFQGQSLLKCLRVSARVRILLADINEDHVSGYFADRVYRVPPLAERARFEAALRDICAREDVHVVFPCTQHELPVLAEMALNGTLGSTRVAVSSPELLETVLDKQSLYEWLAKHALPYLEPVDLAAAGAAELPLFVKPRAGWGGARTRTLRNLEQLTAARRELVADDYVTQRFVDDTAELSADFAIAWSGGISPVVLRARTRVSGGFAVISESVADPTALAICARLAAALRDDGAVGLFNAQLLPEAGAYYVSDLNPRFGTSACFGLGLGVSLPLFLCEAVDPEVHGSFAAPPHRASTVKMVRFLEERFIPELPALRDCRAVLFDLDDTLFDQKAWIADKLVLTFEALSAKLGVARETFLEAGFTLVEHGQKKYLLDEVIAALGLDPTLRTELIDTYRAARPAQAVIYPDVRSALETLRSMGLALGLLTDNPPDSQRQKLEVSGLAQHVDQVAFSREIGKEKPDADTYRAACRLLGFQPAQTCMVGDDYLRDVLGAHRAGLSASFLVRRAGSLSNALPAMFDRALGAQNRAVPYVELHGLDELVHAFRYARRAGHAQT